MTDYTHMSSDDFNGLNYLSEGFMNRYRWQWKQNKNTIWKKVGIIAGMAIAVAAAVVVSIFTFGAATAPVGATLSTVISAGSAALAVTSATGALAVTGYVAAGIIVASVLVATGSTIANASKAAISR
jgi:hypothetical protein